MDERRMRRTARVRMGMELTPRCRSGAAKIRGVDLPQLCRLPRNPA